MESNPPTMGDIAYAAAGTLRSQVEKITEILAKLDARVEALERIVKPQGE